MKMERESKVVGLIRMVWLFETETIFIKMHMKITLFRMTIYGIIKVCI